MRKTTTQRLTEKEWTHIQAIRESTPILTFTGEQIYQFFTDRACKNFLEKRPSVADDYIFALNQFALFNLRYDVYEEICSMKTKIHERHD